MFKDKISNMYKMEEETVTLPKAREGYEYRLMKKTHVRNKDPSVLTPRQLATLRYREKNKEKLSEYNHQYNEKKKKEKL